MSVTEHSTLTSTQPSWWTSRASQEISETITKYTILQSEQREIELSVSPILRNQIWFRQVKARLQKFLMLESNWNGYGEDPIHEGAVKRTIAVLDTVVSEMALQPDIVPTSEGGVQIEWASGGFEVEVEILPTGPAQVFIVEPSGREHECHAGSHSEIWGTLQEIIERISREPMKATKRQPRIGAVLATGQSGVDRLDGLM